MEDMLWFIVVMDSAGICMVLWVRWRMNIDRGLPTLNPEDIPPMPKCKPPKEDVKWDFSEALRALKRGNKVRRVGWGENCYLWLAKPGNGIVHIMGTAIVLNDFQGRTQVWTPAQTEMIATDWMLHVEKNLSNP